MRSWCVALLALVPAFAGCVLPGEGGSEPIAVVPESAPTFRIGWEPADPRVKETIRLDVTPDDPRHAIEDAVWRFGDGTGARGAGVDHVYRDAGVFELEVTLQTLEGHVTTLTHPLTVVDPNASDEPRPSGPATSEPTAGEPAPEPEPRPEPGPEEDDHPPPEQTGYNGFDGEPDDCSKLAPPGPFYSGTGIITDYQPRTLDIVLLADNSFIEVHGDDWRETAMHIATLADEVYKRELNIAVAVVALLPVPTEYLALVNTSSTGLATDESQFVLDQSRRFMDDHFPELDRDLVYTLVGAEIAGSVAGQAECIGGARYKDAAYGWGEADDIEDNTLFIEPLGDKATATKIILHEMAHILGAHHHYANCVEHVPDFDIEDAMGICGMMFNDVGLVGFQFSTANQMAIRGWADYVDL